MAVLWNCQKCGAPVAPHERPVAKAVKYGIFCTTCLRAATPKPGSLEALKKLVGDEER